MELLDVGLIDELKYTHKRWVDETLRIDRHVRESKWSQSVAVGSKEFVEMTKKQTQFPRERSKYNQIR